MSSLDSCDVPLYVLPKHEMDYKHERNLLDLEFKKMAEVRSNNNVEESMASRKVPLKALDYDSMIHILKLLNGKELMEAMEISVEWKKFIEDQSLLMDRAMDEIRFKPNLADVSIEMQRKIFDGNPHKRHYKHMSIFMFISPLVSFGSWLETLELNQHHHRRHLSATWKNIEFPNLKMLRYIGYKEYFGFIEWFTMPVLTHIQLVLDIPSRESCCGPEDFIEWLKSFNSLKCIHIHATCKYLNNIFPEGTLCPWNLNDIDRLDYPLSDQQSDIEQLSIDKFYLDVMIQHVEFLQVFEIYELKPLEFRWILYQMKVLKTLKVDYLTLYNDEETPFPLNESIEILLNKYFPLMEGKMEALLRALPKMKKFQIRREFDANMIRFIGFNMRHLEELIVLSLTDEAREAHVEIQTSPQMNSSFVIVEAPENFEFSFEKSPINECFQKVFKYEKIAPYQTIEFY